MELCPTRRSSRSITQAFSLVELSVALVIIGLLAGGVITGKNLIRSSELRALTEEFTHYKNATLTFRDKYAALPGDMPNAVSYWGAQAGGTADGVDNTCAALNVPAPGKATCNGNGNGFIADGDAHLGPPPIARQQWYEGHRAWQHLSNADLIAGKYSGNSGNDRITAYSPPGVGAPRSKIGYRTTWGFRSHMRDNAAWAEWFYVPAGNFLILLSWPASWTNAPYLTPEEAWRVDTKIDDGKPGLGNIIAFPGTSTTYVNCTVNGSANTDYSFSNQALACALLLLF